MYSVQRIYTPKQASPLNLNPGRHVIVDSFGTTSCSKTYHENNVRANSHNCANGMTGKHYVNIFQSRAPYLAHTIASEQALYYAIETLVFLIS